MKVHSARFARHALALAIAAASSSGAWAGDLISSASASIDNLRYRLIDLDANDGITPALSVNGVWLGSIVSTSLVELANSEYGGAYLQTNQTTPLSYNGVLPMQPSGTATAGLPDGTVASTAGANRLVLNSQLTTQNLLTAAHTDPSYSYTYYTSQDGVNGNRTSTDTHSQDTSTASRTSTLAGAAPGTDLGNRTSDNFPKLDLKVTPHTLLVLEGTSKLDVYADRSNLLQYVQRANAGLNDDDHIHSAYVTASGSAQGSVNVTLTDEASLLYSGGDNGSLSTAVLAANLDYNEDGFKTWFEVAPKTDITSSISQSKAWTLQVTNLGDADKTMYLQAELNTGLSQNINTSTYDTVYTFVPGPAPLPEIPSVPGIPEPGTYALMGLGLAGVALVRRRAHTAA